MKFEVLLNINGTPERFKVIEAPDLKAANKLFEAWKEYVKNTYPQNSKFINDFYLQEKSSK